MIVAVVPPHPEQQKPQFQAIVVLYNHFRGICFNPPLSSFKALMSKELKKNGILDGQRCNEISPRIEYRSTSEGQDLVESIFHERNQK